MSEAPAATRAALGRRTDEIGSDWLFADHSNGMEGAMTCEKCGRESPAAQFCTWCGTRQGGPAAGPSSSRNHQYAAHPGEAVVQPSVFTTLFPHLGHGDVNEFRWAFFAGIGVLLLLYIVGLITAAIIVGAILVPLLYVLYLYQVRVYRDAPVAVVGMTVGGGFVLGLIVTLVFRALTGSTELVIWTPLGTTIDVAGVVVFAVLIPIVEEAVKPIPALLLRRRPDFPESIDGLVFGVAAGLGFAAAVTIIQFSSVITSLPIQTDPADWIYPLITLAVLMPVLQGSATGLISGGLWRSGGTSGPRLGATGIVAAVVAHIAFVLGTVLLLAAGFGQLESIIWQALVVGVLLILVRMFLHQALLQEGADMGLSQIVCPNCSNQVTAAGFCPVCGLAMSASPRVATVAPPDVAAGPRTEGA